MRAVLCSAFAVLAVFATVTDSSVIPSHVNSDSSVPSHVNSDSSDVPSHVNTDSSVPSYVNSDSSVPSYVDSDSSVLSYVNSDSSVTSYVNSDSSVPSYVNSDSSDVPSPHIIDSYEVIDLSSSGSSDGLPFPSAYRSSNSSIDPSASRRSNMFEGTIGPRDRMLEWVNVNRPPQGAFVVQRHTVYFSRPPPAIITSVRAFEQNVLGQGATAFIYNGGVGQTFATVIIISASGGPIYYRVDFWGP